MTKTLAGKAGRSILAPRHAVDLACGMLRLRGLDEIARSARGDSVYLRLPDGAGEIRVSTHRRTARRRAQYPGVAVSIVIDATTSRAKLETRVAAALRDATSRAVRHAG